MVDLKKALADPIWMNHKIGDVYSMKNINGKIDSGWKITYYPIFQDGKTQAYYDEPRALIEKPMKGGTDFREIPLHFLTKAVK